MVQQTKQHRVDVAPRLEGHVLLLLPGAYEAGRTLRAQRAPASVGEWLVAMHQGGYSASWLPGGAIAEGLYHGGTVVEVDVDGDRAYVAVPPETLEALSEVMTPREYQMVREDVAALAHRQGHGLNVARLDKAAWEERRQVLAQGEPLPLEAWARVIRERRLQVELPTGALLALDSPWPGGHVVGVAEAEGLRRSYFALPPGALRLTIALVLETKIRRPEGGQLP